MSPRQHLLLRVVALAVIAALQLFPRGNARDAANPAEVASLHD